jgi:hypothetical protein
MTTTAQQPEALNFRTFTVRAESVDAEKRSVEGIVTTESPVPMFDWERGEVVPEVLLMKGAQYPKQVPFLNAHARFSVDDQLGSARELRTDADRMLGRMFFATAHQSQFEKVREGHVTDLSAGYRILESVYIPRGETQKIDGRDFTGPVNVRTKWRLHEVSLVPIGADDQAKLRGLQAFPLNKKESPKMLQALRDTCVARGMDAKLNDDDAQKWVADNLKDTKRNETPDVKAIVADAVRAATDEFKKSIEEGKRAEESFRKEIDAAIELAGLPGERTACYALKDIASVRTHLLEAKAKAQPEIGYGAPLVAGQAQRDKHLEHIRAALLTRCVDVAANGKKETIEKCVDEPVRKLGATTELRNASLLDLARHCLQVDGVDIRGLTREQIAIAALGFPQQAGIRGAFDPAYHTTGSFPKLTQDAINKTMMVGYTETPTTWRTCFRQAPSAADFKTIHRLRVGALPNLPDWPDNSPLESVSLADAEETYSVQAKSAKISFSYRLLVNDDLSQMSRIPPLFGSAAARTVNALAWAEVTANGTMSDGQALFLDSATGNRKRVNYTSTGTAISVTSVQVGRTLMRLMRGENTPEGNESQDILNLTPRYIVAPVAKEAIVMQLTLSAYDPATSTFMVFNPASQLIPVIEPLLDASSTTAWYLFADPSQIDTVEVTFLQGHENPVTRNWSDPETLSQNYAVLQAVAARRMNHRGMYKNAGA